ncbi:MAG: hypothetical protein HRT69_07040 [Flavobacteriaceae bacterium]|nr:hypothetical protein [Flavobacteriaceae bacterium]
MKDNIENLLDELSEKIITASNLEAPSLDFTANIMSNINVAAKQSESTIYTPLISKKTWFIIAVIFIVVCAYLLLGSTSESIGWFTNVDFSFAPSFNMASIFSEISFSKTVLYATVVLALMLFIQIPLLKKHFDNRISFE